MTGRRPRSAFVCPGSDAYGPAWLGSLPIDHPAVAAADAIRLEYGLEPLGELDRAAELDPARHLRPANAAALTFMGTLLDAERAADDHRLVAVLGAGGGWPSALAVAGALPFEDAFRLAQEVALLREDALSAARGGQVIYPLLDADWEPSADLRAAVADALSDGGQHPAFASVDLGGFAILAGDEPAVTRLLEQLPAVTLAGRRFPLRLAMQGPDHTPLAEGVAEVAAERLGGLRWQAPETTLIDGRGARWTPWSADPAALRDYSLGDQLVAPFRFTTALRVALRELAPELVVVAGSRGALAGVVGQVVVDEGYRGIRSRATFQAAQLSAAPLVLSMGRAT